MICGSGGSKSRLAKAAGAEPAGEKLHAVVARSIFSSQNVLNTSALDRFWKLRCRKSARRCGAKHMSKSKCTKHTRSGPLLVVETSKKCTQLWREAHVQVKMLKTPRARTTFGRSDVASLHYTTLHYTTLHSATLHYTTLHSTTTTTTAQLRSTTLHYTTLHYITLHSTIHYNYTTVHYTTVHYLPLHFTTLHYTPLQLQLQLHNYTPLHYLPLHFTTLHYTTLQLQLRLHNYTSPHSTTLNYAPQQRALFRRLNYQKWSGPGVFCTF